MAANSSQINYKRYVLNIVALYQNRPDVKAYLEILLSMATIAIFVIFAIKPTLVTIANLITTIHSLQQTSDDLTTKINNLSIAQNLYNKEGSNINLLNAAIPTGPDVATYVRQIEGVMKKDGVTPTSTTVDKVDLLQHTTGSNGFNVGVSGSYSQLTGFMHDIENLRRPSQVNKLNISLVQVSDKASMLFLVFSAQAPFD